MGRIRFYLIFIALGLLIKPICAQKLDLKKFDYSVADSVAFRYHKKRFKTTAELSYALTKDLKTEHEKFRALFRWVTDNVQYSYAARNNTPLNVMKRKKAVCQGYSDLLREMCIHASIKCETIIGYAKSVDETIGKFKETNHAWNAVRLNSEWYLVDATWAAGSVYKRRFTKEFNSFFFLTPPKFFKYRHLPENRKWLLTEWDISLKDYGKLPAPNTGFYLNEVRIEDNLRGAVRNQLKISFTSEVKLFEASIFFPSEEESEAVELKEENGQYYIEHSLKGKPKEYFYLYLDGINSMTFLKK